MKTVRRPPYPKWNPGYFPCSSLTPLPLSSRRPSVSFGGFGLRREQVCRLLEPVVRFRGLRLPNKALYAEAFDLYRQRGISFTDGYNVAYMKARALTEVYSYDTDFDRVEGISRIEPAT